MVGTVVNAEERADIAEALLTHSSGAPEGVWPRATAWVLRLSLEEALRSLWRSVAPQLEACPMRAQLLALTKFVNPNVAQSVRALWHALSRVAHHHAYELAPTATELRTWQRETRRIATELAHAEQRNIS